MELPEQAEAIEVRLVLEAIYERYGYDFRQYSTESIRRRVNAALSRSGLAHLGELQHKLLLDPSFFATVLDDLTVRVSGMFRDPGFFLAFRRRVVPILRTYPHVKIWHAGCATGEEVYATAILLTEESLYERCQIYATDVSVRALESAREGIYDQGDIDGFETYYRESGGTGRFQDYYSAAYGRIALKESLRKNVVFFQHDLASDFDIGQVHVILCRNVLIYFGPALRDRVMEMFAGALCRGGFLCLGSSERLQSSHARSFDEFAPFERIYRSRGES